MKILLDENVPRPLVEIIRHLLRAHEVIHVSDLGWNGKPDAALLKDAARRHFQVFVTNDERQYQDPSECKAIKDSGLHHVIFKMPASGLDGLALASAALCAGIRGVVGALEAAPSQRLGSVKAVSNAERFEVRDPGTHPPSHYWPS